jgi:hypothetical protein
VLRIARHTSFLLIDPINVPAVWDLIAKSTELAPRKGIQRKTRKSSSLSGLVEHRRIPDLPLDLQFLILDLLCHSDISNLLQALEWRIPDSYWRSRIHGFIFEMEGLASTVDIDWQFFSLKAEQLLESSEGLRNRQRILQKLKGTKTAFFEIAR